MAGISPVNTATTQFNSTNRAAEVERPVQPVEPVVEDQPFNYFDLINLADDLAAIAAQLRRRTEAEKSSPNSSDPFDRILEDEAEPKVEQLLLLTQKAQLTPQELLLQARSMFPDDSDLILVLREIIKRRKLRNEETDVLEEVMQLIWAESNPKLVKAGMNVGIKAQLFAKKMAVTPWALRETYRQFLSSNEGEIIQYEQWVEQYGNGRRHLVAEFIETALLHDIQSHDPSCSRDEFGSLLNHVVTFKKLRFSDKAFMQVFLKGSKHESNREIEALACWFDCLQRPFKIQKEIEKNRLSQLMERLNLTQPVLIQKMIAAVKVLDADLFFDVAVKDILIQALLNMEKKP